MGEQPLSEAIGIDGAAVEALARAGVQTVQQLADADVDAVAMASGIPAERVEDWQQKARRAGAKHGPSPVAKAWMVGAIGVVLAIILGYALIWIGSRRLQQAEGIRVASESKLQLAVSFAAGEAIDQLRQARLALHANNWGSAQKALSGVEDKVTLIEQVAPDSMKGDVTNVHQLIGDLQNAVTQQASDTSTKLDSLEAALDTMKQGQK